MAHLDHCLVTQKLQSTYFNVLYAYFIILPNIRLHYATDGRATAYSEREHEFTFANDSVFTARRSYASAVLGVVILSVRPSVCLSHACFVTSPKNLPAIFYTI